MRTARIATTIAFLALILPVAALVFTKSTWAASGNVQECRPNTSCTVGEFLYNDSYSPITTATCTITSRYPNGTLFLNAVNMPVSAEGDGWYAYTFTAPSTLGLYRTEVKCTVGTETLALDKSFEVQTAPVTSVPSANDVAVAVWGYSSRSLTTFGTLVADIWKNTTRTVTGFDSGTFATSTDISGVKTNVDDVKSVADKIRALVEEFKPSTTSTSVTNIQNITSETRNLFESVINRPTIDTLLLEEGGVTTIDLQTKLEKSENLANQLLTSGTYIKSKTNLLKLKWSASWRMGEAEITKTLAQLESIIGEENDTQDKSSIFGQITWITQQWNLPVSSKLYAQSKKIVSSLKKVNSASQLKVLSSDLDSFIKLVGSSNDSPKSNTLFGQLKVQKELLASLDKNEADATTLLSDITKDSKPKIDLVAQINDLNTRVIAVNQLPKINKTLLSRSNIKMDQKQLKNKTLSLKGVVQANRQLIAQGPNQPLRSLWLEEGSIVFKTLISNPSKLISQKIPLKYYLPKEVTRENIIKTDEELTINYDTEKDQYYVSGSFTLDPGETKTLTVTVDDSAFHINDQEIATMRKQTEELSKPLQNTAYFAQGVTLKTDIDASLDKVESLQKNNTTPEARIRSYRESIIEFKAAKEKLEKLKEITTNAGSVGTLFGFVGGAQAIAVWGLIIIMAAGFVFLALYMRALRGSEKYSAVNKLSPIDDSFENYEEILNEEKPLSQNPPKKRFPFQRPVKYLAVILVSVLIGGSGIYGLWIMRQGQIKDQVSQTPSQAKTDVDQAVLGSSDTNTQDSYERSSSSSKEVNILVLVPEESTVTIHSEPSVNSPVLISLNASKQAKEVSREGFWVKVILQNQDGKNIEGWVDGDFVETESEKSEENIESEAKQNNKSSAEPTKTITIKDTPTGFLRVRKTPGGEEITKISPGEQYNLVKEAIGWVQIVLEDGTSGWVSKQYINF